MQTPKRRVLRRGGVALAVGAVLAGCAQNPRHGAGEDPCDPVVGAVIGGVAGAIIGGDKHRARGAVLGAGVGALACVAYNYHASQTKTAQQVGDEYRKVNNGQLPPAPVVTAYRTEAARPTAKGGDDMTVRSSIEIVPGAKEPLRELREEFVIVDPNGVERSRIAKTPAAADAGGGAFVSTLQFTFPRGIPPGEYQVRSRLYVNGAPAKTNAVSIRVAQGASGAVGVALARMDRR